MDSTAECSTNCLANVESKHFNQEVNVQWSWGNFGECQKNCGIDYAGCLLTTFDTTSCTTKEAGCAAGCIFKVENPMKEEVKPVEIKVKGMKECQSKCLLIGATCLFSKSKTQCAKETGACSVSCLLQVTEKAKKMPVVKSAISDCEKNCGIDLGICTVRTFDLK